jgi:hypothetical protein
MCDYFEHMGDFKIYAECDNSKVFVNCAEGTVTRCDSKASRTVTRCDSKASRTGTHCAKGTGNKGNKKPGVFPLLMGMIEDLVKNGIKQDELNMAKSYLKSKMMLKAEDCDVLAKHNGKLLLFGLAHIPFCDVYKKCIESITKKQMDACIKKYFRHDGMTVSVISSNSAIVKQEKYESFLNTVKI